MVLEEICSEDIERRVVAETKLDGIQRHIIEAEGEVGWGEQSDRLPRLGNQASRLERLKKVGEDIEAEAPQRNHDSVWSRGDEARSRGWGGAMVLAIMSNCHGTEGRDQKECNKAAGHCTRRFEGERLCCGYCTCFGLE